MTSPISPETVAQMLADLDLFSRCGDVGVMDRDMAIDAKATITTLAAENATLRAEFELLTAVKDAHKMRGDNHWETLRSIRVLAQEGKLDHIIQHVNDAGAGYTQPDHVTMWELQSALAVANDRIATLRASEAAANARADAAGSALERDRSFVADTVNAVLSEISGREWMLTGRGPYEWDDDRYRDEFGSALSAIRAPIEKLRAIARDWSNRPTDPVEIQKSRTDWKARADAAWDALRNIAELNKTARDENGHAWDNSDLIAQEIHFALRAKPAPAVTPKIEVKFTWAKGDEEFWVHLKSPDGKSAGFNLGNPKGMIATALLRAIAGGGDE